MAVGVPIPINHSLDFTVGFSVHGYIPPGMPPTFKPIPSPAIEFPVPQDWLPGVGAGTVQKTTTVFVGGSAIIQEGHDVGPLIPQITFPQPNIWDVTLPFDSSRKIMFQSFYTRMNEKQVGLTNVIPIPLPMLACGEPVSIPLTFPMFNFLNSVRVGMTFADLIGGWVNILLTMGGEYLTNKIWPQKRDKDGKPIDREGKELRNEIFGSALLGGVAGLISSGVQQLIDPNYPVKFEFSIEHGKATYTIGGQFGSADTTNNPSSASVSPKVTAKEDKNTSNEKKTGTEASANAKVEWTWDAGENTDKEGGKVTAGVEGKSPGANAKAEGNLSYNADDGFSRGASAEGNVAGGASGKESVTTSSEGTTKTSSTTVGNTTTTTTTGPDGTTETTAFGPPL